MAVGLTRTATHRYFWGDEGPFPSVTTIIGVLDKSGPLVAWAKSEVAACAIRNIDLLTQLAAQPGGKDAAEAWLRGIPDYQKDAAADLGTRVHAYAESLNIGQEPTDMDPDARASVEQYRDFLAVMRPEIVAAEYMGLNPSKGYGGTGDLIARMDGYTYCLDIKTGASVYASTALQLAACADFTFIGKPDDPTEYPMPKVDRYGVIHVRPDGWRLVPFYITEDTFAAFDAAIALYRWNQTSTRLMGAAITREAAA